MSRQPSSLLGEGLELLEDIEELFACWLPLTVGGAKGLLDDLEKVLREFEDENDRLAGLLAEKVDRMDAS